MDTMEVDKTLFCGNLRQDRITEEILYELFLQAGPLEKVKIPTEKDGRKKNFAFITFKHPESVPFTICLMNGIKLYDRSLTLQPRPGSIHAGRPSMASPQPGFMPPPQGQHSSGFQGMPNNQGFHRSFSAPNFGDATKSHIRFPDSPQDSPRGGNTPDRNPFINYGGSNFGQMNRSDTFPNQDSRGRNHRDQGSHSRGYTDRRDHSRERHDARDDYFSDEHSRFNDNDDFNRNSGGRDTYRDRGSRYNDGPNFGTGGRHRNDRSDSWRDRMNADIPDRYEDDPRDRRGRFVDGPNAGPDNLDRLGRDIRRRHNDLHVQRDSRRNDKSRRGRQNY